MPTVYRPQEIIMVLEHLGWQIERQRGAHVNLTREGRPGLITVPTSGREVRSGAFRNILKQAGLRQVEFEAAARQALEWVSRNLRLFFCPTKTVIRWCFPIIPIASLLAPLSTMGKRTHARPSNSTWKASPNLGRTPLPQMCMSTMS